MMSIANTLRTVMLVLAATSMTAGCAGPGHASMSDDSATITRLRAQADAWDRAIVRKDRTAIEANMAVDFRQIDGQGHVESRASFVDDLMSPDLIINPYAVEDLDVRLYGDTALLSGTTRMTGSYGGKVFASHYRYIDVYVKALGRWQLVSVQITRLPAD